MNYYDEFGGESSVKPSCRHITDILRVTVSMADPFLLHVFHTLLHYVPNFQVRQVKNKYKAGSFENSGSPSVLVKVAVAHSDGDCTLCEVQLYIESFLSLKKLQHKIYG